MLVATSIGDTSLRPLSGSGAYTGTAPAGRKRVNAAVFLKESDKDTKSVDMNILAVGRVTSVRDNAHSRWLPNAESHPAKPKRRVFDFRGCLLNRISAIRSYAGAAC